jgi:hypothetical protein
MKTCVFCGSNVKISKEHVWSSCLLKKRKGNNKYTSNSVADKFVGPNSLQIKDVCEKCNNGNLSELDSYICQLYDSQFKNIIEPNDQILFEYDFSLLSRWLFKTLYNNARSGNADKFFIALLNTFNQYILNGTNNPTAFLVFLQLIIPYEEGNTKIPPTYMTAGPINIPKLNVEDVYTFVLCIDSFRFFIVIPTLNKEINIYEFEELFSQLPATKASVRLTDSIDNQLISASEITTLYAVGPLIMNNLNLWIKLIEKE